MPKLAGGLVGLKAKQRLDEISKLGREAPTAIAPDVHAQVKGRAGSPSSEDAAVISSPHDLLSKKGFVVVVGKRTTSQLIYPIHVPKLSTYRGVLEIAVEDTRDNEGDRGMYVRLFNHRKQVVFRAFDKTGDWKSWSFPVQEQTDWFVVLEDRDSEGNGVNIRVTIQPGTDKPR